MVTSRRPDAAPPQQIITATLRLLETPNPDYGAKKILLDLAGHGYELIHHPPEPARCPEHPNTKLNALGDCPICGPKGL